MATAKRVKVGANDPCPCFSGKKYKHCCRGQVEWPDILGRDIEHVEHMSARGRNFLFALEIADALQLDNEDQLTNIAKHKKAFTPTAVRKIHEAVYNLWPPETNLAGVLAKSRGTVAGLYVGDYETGYLERAVVRSCLYADKILLVDPFMHPHGVTPQYNPVENPDQYRTQTFKNVMRFTRFLPWIDAGIVEFIRTLEDLDPAFRSVAMEEAEKYKNVPELSEAIDASVAELMARHRDNIQQELFFTMPDTYLRKIFQEMSAESPTKVTEEQVLEYVKQVRANSPDVLETIDETGSQLRMTTSGASIPSAKIAAEMAGAYIFTDINARWEILKYEREKLSAESKEWSPFAKALSEVELNFLNNVDLDIALRLRDEGKLNGVRGVLRQSWKAELGNDPYDDTSAIKLKQNLVTAIDEARGEWEEIRASLAKFNLNDLVLSSGLAAATTISTGHVELIASASAAIGVTTSRIYKHHKAQGFAHKFPASFFLSLDD
ncbi:MAG TPA: hypothetical protein DHW36_03490 [Thalassospira sp.]|nr:hypothetical protein [Thalassospira sp.]HCK17555.1 hypothetical protein [Thalassospira sp.]